MVNIEYNMLGGSSLLPETEQGDPEQQFELLDLLGQGAYGSVSKALHKRTGELFAIKILSASSLSQLTSIKKEIQILKLCDNHHIVKYYGTYFKDNNLWIVLQYCHAGSIIDLLNITQKKLTQNQIASILQSVLNGLIYLHAHKKIHRDIKAANILLNKEGVAKLADFGVSAQSMYTNAGHKSQVGSPYWMSPEVMKHSQYTNKTDIWSLGVTAIELAEGVVPNSNLKPLIAMWQLKDKPVQSFKNPERWSGEFNSFVKDCLNTNPDKRPEARALLSHPFIVNNSRGQPLLAELVQRSLADIEQFRLGQEKSQDSEQDLMQILNRSVTNGTRTIVNNRTERSREQSVEPFQSSMIINEENASMIVNSEDASMIEVDGKEKPSLFLNKYLSDMKKTEGQTEMQKEAMRKKVQSYDEACLTEIQAIFSKHKEIIKNILQEGLDQEFFGMDQDFIKNQLKSKLHVAQNPKDFILKFLKYQEVKSFERSDKSKKKTACHNSTQTNDLCSSDLFAFPKEFQPRGVKSQQFPDKQFRTTEKQHCFNSKSIISDIEGIKYYKELHNDDSRGKIARRFIVTEPYDGIFDRPNIPPQDKARLRTQFLGDPDVKESIRIHIQATGKTDQLKFDKIVAESTLYNCDWGEESGGLKQHQNSMTIMKGNSQQRNHYSQQEHLLPADQYEEDDTQINTQIFHHKGSVKLTKNSQSRHAKKLKGKRLGQSADKKGRANYSSGTGQRRNHAK